MHKFMTMSCAVAALFTGGAAQANGFVNGGFESNDTSGWQTGGGFRDYRNGSALSPSQFLPGGSLREDNGTRSAVIDKSYVDPTFGAAFGSTVYSGDHAYRVEDTASGGFASVISQTVRNYTDSNIFFAWKAVLENGGHSAEESALMVITLRDLTTGTDLISRIYNAGGGTDARFTRSGNYFYTGNWQIEQLTIDATRNGHDFQLSVLAADCGPTGHEGYVYLDGFGAVTPPPVSAVPEPATWMMMIAGFGAIGSSLRRRRKVSVTFA